MLALVFTLAAPLRADEAKTLSASAFASELAALQQLATACAGNALACDPSKMPPPQQVQMVAAGGSFGITWAWLGEALSSAKTSSAGDRAKAMGQVRAHLGELARQAGAGQALPVAGVGRARAAANTALARDEFRAAEGPGWLDRQLARVQDAMLRLFTGMGRLGQRAPWLAPLVEWGCFGLAAAGLLWFVRQSLRRQSLRISLSDAAPPLGHGDRNGADWAGQAERNAAAGKWREAVHCLYWAAINLLESRRAWRANPTRTPREYLRLLQPGSGAERALRELTRSFEHVWYGHTEASEDGYRMARESFRALEAARPERAPGPPQAVGTAPPLAAAGGS